MCSAKTNTKSPIESSPDHDEIFSGAVAVAQTLAAKGFEAYFVGGCVRDLLLQQPSHDIDIATDASAKEVAKIFSRSVIIQPREAYGVTIVKHFGHIYEVATFRQDIGSDGRRPKKIIPANLEEDLWRRDFTINALAFNPISNQLIDVTGGLEDINHRIIRFVGEPRLRIAEDRLRILRAIRFKNRFGFNYSPDTADAIIKAVKLGSLHDLAAERIFDECSRMLINPNRANAIKDMQALGILADILPEIDACIGIEQPRKYHTEGDVFAHTLLVLDSLPKICSVPLAWAGLLHDVGKPITFETGLDGQIHFKGHAEAGVHIASAVLKRLRMPKKMIDATLWLISKHMLFDNWSKMRQSTKLRYFQNPLFSDLVALLTADHNGSYFENEVVAKSASATFNDIVKQYKDYVKNAQTNPHPTLKDIGIDGRYLIDNYNIKPGPMVGHLIERLNDAILEDEIHNLDEARELINKWL